jgi:diaminohydroxyphosphoribosylaminopyrimidine deaminase/5-amino-6-(5-phosphoribosylamino)uracil reductase
MVNQSLTYEHFMSVALSLGRRGLGKTWPNPSVGCVIVRDGIVVGRGLTGKGGRPHAETQALTQAGKRAKGSTVFVTLEPCSHQGQTGSCARALIEAGVNHVVVAIKDNDPRVNGSGVRMLRSAGIKVTTGVLSDEAKSDHNGFLLKNNQSRPKVTLKLATSLDGRIAARTGDSQWITNERSREIVQLQRSHHDAIMIGAGTARNDNPRLTVRNNALSANPVRIIISDKINLPIKSKLFTSMKSHPTWIIHGGDTDQKIKKAWTDEGAKLLKTENANGKILLKNALINLASEGITSVYCEGGSTLAASLLADNFVDELIIFTAGVIIGGDGLPTVASLGLDNLKDARRLNLLETMTIDGDVMTRWSFN